MLVQPITIYETVQRTTPQTTIADVLVGAASVVFGLAVLAVALGVFCGAILINVRRIRGASGSTDPNAVTRLGIDAPPKSQTN